MISPDRAAAYLGLGSRWAIYRLISTGQLPAVKLAGKVRIDRADLDAFIEALKCQTSEQPVSCTRQVAAGVPGKLGPLPRRGSRRSSVTVPVTAEGHGV